MTEVDIRTLFDGLLDSPPGQGPDLGQVIDEGRRRRRHRRLVAAPLAAALLAGGLAVALTGWPRPHHDSVAAPVVSTAAQVRAKIEQVLDRAVRQVSPKATVLPLMQGTPPEGSGVQYTVSFTDVEGTGSVAVLVHPAPWPTIGCQYTLTSHAQCSNTLLPDGSHLQEISMWRGSQEKDGFVRGAAVQRPGGTLIVAQADNFDRTVLAHPTPTRVRGVPTISQLAAIAREITAFYPR